IAQPVVPDHPLFVWIRDGALFQLRHGDESLLYLGLHRREEVVWKIHPAQVQGQAEGRKFCVPLLKTPPKLCFRISHTNDFYLSTHGLQMKSRIWRKNENSKGFGTRD